MTFFLSKLLWGLVRPSTVLMLLGLAGLVLGWQPRWRRAGLVLLTLSLGGFWAVYFLPVDQWALLPLEDRFSRPDPPPAHVDGIIVLGGVINSELSHDRGIPSMTAAGERITEAVALTRRYPDAKLVFTGGNGDDEHPEPSEADHAQTMFTALGVERPIIREGRSRNTVENALYSKAIVHPKPGEVWLLVTSASHMPRSVGIFRQAGWPVVPWPVGYKTGHEFETQYDHEFGEKFIQLDWAVHEWVGLVAYRLLGRTSALFPAPEK